MNKRLSERLKIIVVLIVFVLVVSYVYRGYIEAVIDAIPPNCGAVLYGQGTYAGVKQHPIIAQGCLYGAYKGGQSAWLILYFNSNGAISYFNLSVNSSSRGTVKVRESTYSSSGKLYDGAQVVFGCDSMIQNSGGLFLSRCGENDGNFLVPSDLNLSLN